MTDLFKEKAQDWDANDKVRGLSSGIGAAIQANVILDKTMSVMDFGAGTGLITAQIADKVKKVTAVDVSEAMLDKLMAKEALQGAAIKASTAKSSGYCCHDTISRTFVL